MGADMKTMQASPLPGARGSAGGRKLLERLRVSGVGVEGVLRGSVEGGLFKDRLLLLQSRVF